jgi:hypothetical protein
LVHILIENGAPSASERPKSAPAQPRKCPAVAAYILQISFWTSLMSAAHIASDDFADMHLDSTGDSFGATEGIVSRK